MSKIINFFQPWFLWTVFAVGVVSFGIGAGAAVYIYYSLVEMLGK